MMVEKKLSCLECGKPVANTPNVLARHLRTQHSIEWADYIVKHDHGGQWPTCACGCGELLQWRKGGFGKYSKGHDISIQKHVVVQSGWVANPFTGKEEHITSDDEIALLEHCLANNDPITHDHGIRVGWEDASGKLRTVIPSFKHLKQKLLLTIDVASDPDYGRRLAGFKQWCNMHDHMLLILRRTVQGFIIIGGHNPRK